MTLRKEYLGRLDDGLGSLYTEVLVILVIDALDSVTYRWQMIVLCPLIEVSKDASLSVSGFSG